MKKAMTIGELLVTMSIIGIIAALVLPGFLKDYHNKLYVAHLKKVYEMLDSAVNQACSDSNVSYFYQTPYSKRVLGDSSNAQSFLDKYLKKSTRTTTNSFSVQYKKLNGSSDTAANGRPLPLLPQNSAWAKLTSGETVAFLCGDPYCKFYVDINSTDGPNIYGRDFFTITLNTRTNELGGGQYSATNCLDGTRRYGVGCLEKIMQDNWEMKY